MKTLKHPLPDKLGRIIPVAGIVYNPTHEWLEAIWRFHHAKDQLRDGKKVPYYGGSKVHAVLMMGGSGPATPPSHAMTSTDDR